ncbi:hypothetical protein CAEBREN_25047 [Caenorhabditis brenneri]|uniref:Uncharacterized protein n=1 Tax=Caenorhabditis brenneri TaxID=135651 RepID=G0PLJ1_CAEBE|nr:hypothetical protein CAEBREN_25047 [Caenorhabditis brenneri]
MGQLQKYSTSMLPDEVDRRHSREMIERQKAINKRAGASLNSSIPAPEIIVDSASEYTGIGSARTGSSWPSNDTFMVDNEHYNSFRSVFLELPV